MGTLIRSQDKEKLINAVDAFYENDCNKSFICCRACNGYYYKIGKYSSKEKAIKVLDMIQEHIEKSNCNFGAMNTREFIGNIYTQEVKMFQMPQDKEVEV